MTADDGRVGADAGAVFDEGRQELAAPADMGAREQYVGEHHRRAAEDIVFQRYALIDRHIVLDLAAIPDPHIGSDHHVLAEIAVGADLRAGKDMSEMPDFGAGTDFN